MNTTDIYWRTKESYDKGYEDGKKEMKDCYTILVDLVYSIDLSTLSKKANTLIKKLSAKLK